LPCHYADQALRHRLVEASRRGSNATQVRTGCDAKHRPGSQSRPGAVLSMRLRPAAWASARGDVYCFSHLHRLLLFLHFLSVPFFTPLVLMKIVILSAPPVPRRGVMLNRRQAKETQGAGDRGRLTRRCSAWCARRLQLAEAGDPFVGAVVGELHRARARQGQVGWRGDAQPAQQCRRE
jgi:hypothetical protein